MDLTPPNCKKPASNKASILFGFCCIKLILFNLNIFIWTGERRVEESFDNVRYTGYIPPMYTVGSTNHLSQAYLSGITTTIPIQFQHLNKRRKILQFSCLKKAAKQQISSKAYRYVGWILCFNVKNLKKEWSWWYPHYSGHNVGYC